jgi:hypothetical protein
MSWTITMTVRGKLKPTVKKKDSIQGGWIMLKERKGQQDSPRRGSKSWYQDYLKHPTAQFKMSFVEYKDLRMKGKIK